MLETPPEPTSFVKYNYCLSGHDWSVERPEGIVRLDYEPELVFVIGKRALGVKKAQAFDHVAGVTILNEMEISHPAAKMIVEISKVQETEVGDGTTTAVVIGGELLKQAEDLLDKGDMSEVFDALKELAASGTTP